MSAQHVTAFDYFARVNWRETKIYIAKRLRAKSTKYQYYSYPRQTNKRTNQTKYNSEVLLKLLRNDQHHLTAQRCTVKWRWSSRYDGFYTLNVRPHFHAASIGSSVVGMSRRCEIKKMENSHLRTFEALPTVECVRVRVAHSFARLCCWCWRWWVSSWILFVVYVLFASLVYTERISGDST